MVTVCAGLSRRQTLRRVKGSIVFHFSAMNSLWNYNFQSGHDLSLFETLLGLPITLSIKSKSHSMASTQPLMIPDVLNSSLPSPKHASVRPGQTLGWLLEPTMLSMSPLRGFANTAWSTILSLPCLTRLSS